MSENDGKHTPGPWRISVQPVHSPHRLFVTGSNGHQITFFQESKKGSHRGEQAVWLGFRWNELADAHLISAAPDMLEALELALELLEKGDHQIEPLEIMARMRDAISKARAWEK